MIPVEGQIGLYRDETTNAIINCNDFEYNQYLKIKNEKLLEKNEIDNLKKEIDEIKTLLYKLLETKS